MSQMKDEIREILKKMYVTVTPYAGEDIDEAVKRIQKLISQNYIPKERVLSREEIITAIEVKLWGNNKYYKKDIGTNITLMSSDLAEAIIEKGSIGKVGVEEIKDTIVNNKITPELVEKHFPKGQCNERGNAIVLHAEMLIELARVTSRLFKRKGVEG